MSAASGSGDVKAAAPLSPKSASVGSSNASPPSSDGLSPPSSTSGDGGGSSGSGMAVNGGDVKSQRPPQHVATPPIPPPPIAIASAPAVDVAVAATAAAATTPSRSHSLQPHRDRSYTDQPLLPPMAMSPHALAVQINGVTISVPPPTPMTAPNVLDAPHHNSGGAGSGAGHDHGHSTDPMTRAGKKHRHRGAARRAESIEADPPVPNVIQYGGRIRLTGPNVPGTGPASAVPMQSPAAMESHSPSLPTRPSGGGGVSKRALAFHQNVITGPQPQFSNLTAEEHEMARAGILVVISIVRTSPAEEAGLKCGDIITQFGNLTRQNFMSITQVVPLIKNNPGRALPIVVLRKTKPNTNGNGTGHGGGSGFAVLQLSVTPARWSNGGVMGCVVNWWPIPQPESASAAHVTAAALAQPQPFGRVMQPHPQHYTLPSQSLLPSGPTGSMGAYNPGGAMRQYAPAPTQTVGLAANATAPVLVPVSTAPVPQYRAPARLPASNNLRQFFA